MITVILLFGAAALLVAALVIRARRAAARRAAWREHEDSPGCWCGPECIYESDGGRQVWVHNDPRGSKPPAKVIAEAVADAWLDRD